MLLKKEVELFLKQLRRSSITEVEKYLLGVGSAREVYNFKDNFIIKVPRYSLRFPDQNYTPEEQLNIFNNGMRQIKKEIEVYNYCDERIKYLLNPIVLHGKYLNIPYIVMPKVTIASNDNYSGNINQYIRRFCLYVPWSFKQDIRILSDNYDLYYDDLTKNSENFGINSDNKVCLVDYGTRS